MIGRLRKPVDQISPGIGRAYRLVRDIVVRRRPRPTTFGFTLAGDPTMTTKSWEEAETQFFLSRLDSHDQIIDIGANIGFYSCLAAQFGKPVLSIEPSRRNQDFLYRNLWENSFRKVEVAPVALSSEPGITALYGFGGLASLVQGWGQSSQSSTQIVPSTTLDRLTIGRFAGARLLIKLDVEGFELEVLRGASETLKREPKPTWLVEIILHDDVVPGGGTNALFYETFKLFWKNGYTCRKAAKVETIITPEAVARWARNGHVDGESSNFIFSSE